MGSTECHLVVRQYKHDIHEIHVMRRGRGLFLGIASSSSWRELPKHSAGCGCGVVARARLPIER